MTPLQKILENYRATSQTEREKGTYFEELIRTYARMRTDVRAPFSCGPDSRTPYGSKP